VTCEVTKRVIRWYCLVLCPGVPKICPRRPVTSAGADSPAQRDDGARPSRASLLLIPVGRQRSTAHRSGGKFPAQVRQSFAATGWPVMPSVIGSSFRIDRSHHGPQVRQCPRDHLDNKIADVDATAEQGCQHVVPDLRWRIPPEEGATPTPLSDSRELRWPDDDPARGAGSLSGIAQTAIPTDVRRLMVGRVAKVASPSAGSYRGLSTASLDSRNGLLGFVNFRLPLWLLED
jgi:hypothetical protein